MPVTHIQCILGELSTFSPGLPCYLFHDTVNVYSIEPSIDAVSSFQKLLFPFYDTEFLPGRFLQKLLDIGFCGGNWTERVCYDIGGFIFGFDDSNNNMSRVPVYLSNWPAGTSLKNIIHFGQIIVAGKCQMFDYGRKGNRKHYNQDTPPVYNVTKMNTPTAFFYGGHDSFSNRTDVLGLIPEITNLKVNTYIAEYNHIDFVFGIDAPKVLYNRILDIIDEILTVEQ